MPAASGVDPCGAEMPRSSGETIGSLAGRIAAAGLVMLVVIALPGCGGGGVATTGLPSLAASVKSLKMRIGTPPRVAAICRDAQRELRVAQHNPKAVVVCPRLVPDAPILLGYPGTFGLASNATTRDFYALTFNNGGSDPTGPLSLHWIVGRGTWAAIRREVLSDAHNEVKGRPTYLGTRVVEGRRVRVYRFPERPAGGMYGSHTIAFVAVGRQVAFASVHGAHLDASIAMAVAYAESG